MQNFLSMPRPVLDAILYHHLCAEPLLEFPTSVAKDLYTFTIGCCDSAVEEFDCW